MTLDDANGFRGKMSDFVLTHAALDITDIRGVLKVPALLDCHHAIIFQQEVAYLAYHFSPCLCACLLSHLLEPYWSGPFSQGPRDTASFSSFWSSDPWGLRPHLAMVLDDALVKEPAPATGAAPQRPPERLSPPAEPEIEQNDKFPGGALQYFDDYIILVPGTGTGPGNNIVMYC